MVGIFKAPLSAADVKAKARALGADLVGIADGRVLDANPPDPADPRRPIDVTEPDTKTDYYDSRFTLAMDFWLTVAAQFKDPAILYELWNEPISGNEEDEGVGLTYWKKYRPYWRVLTDAIRSSGNSNVMLVAPPLWAFNARGLTQSLLPDANTVVTISSIAYNAVTLGTGRYDGRPMPVHVKLPGVEAEHFDRWLGLFRQTASEVCPTEAAALFMDRAERIAQSFRMGISLYRENQARIDERLAAGSPPKA